MSTSPKAKKQKVQKVHRDSDFPVLQNDLIFRVIRGEIVEKTPVWIMRQAGRYLPEFRLVRAEHDFFKVCQTPELACQVTLQPIDRFPGLLDASIIFSDILVVPQAMGMEVQMIPGKGPHFPEPLVGPEDLNRLIPAPVDVDSTLSYVYHAITLTRTKLDGRVPLFGFVGAPWTLMAYMIEGGGSKTLSKAKTWLFKHEKSSLELLQRITDVVIAFLIGQAKAGAQLLQVFESWGGELSPADFAKFSLPFLKQIAVKVKKALREIDLNVPMAIFARGSHYALDDLEKTSYDIVSLDWTISPVQARKALKTKTLQGNADPSLLYGEPETIRKVAGEMVKAFGKERYIANLGHGMLPDHDPEHLRAYLEAIRDFSS